MLSKQKSMDSIYDYCNNNFDSVNDELFNPHSKATRLRGKSHKSNEGSSKYYPIPIGETSRLLAKSSECLQNDRCDDHLSLSCSPVKSRVITSKDAVAVVVKSLFPERDILSIGHDRVIENKRSDIKYKRRSLGNVFSIDSHELLEKELSNDIFNRNNIATNSGKGMSASVENLVDCGKKRASVSKAVNHKKKSVTIIDFNDQLFSTNFNPSPSAFSAHSSSKTRTEVSKQSALFEQGSANTSLLNFNTPEKGNVTPLSKISSIALTSNDLTLYQITPLVLKMDNDNSSNQISTPCSHSNVSQVICNREISNETNASKRTEQPTPITQKCDSNVVSTTETPVTSHQPGHCNTVVLSTDKSRLNKPNTTLESTKCSVGELTNEIETIVVSNNDPVCVSSVTLLSTSPTIVCQSVFTTSSASVSNLPITSRTSRTPETSSASPSNQSITARTSRTSELCSVSASNQLASSRTSITSEASSVSTSNQPITACTSSTSETKFVQARSSPAVSAVSKKTTTSRVKTEGIYQSSSVDLLFSVWYYQGHSSNTIR